MSAKLASFFVSASMYWNRWRLRSPLLSAADSVASAQLELLQDILSINRDTTFGSEHKFSTIKSFADYRRQVPIRNYDGLAPYIKLQMGGEAALTAAAPVYYARTSGTTGSYKDLPLTQDGVQQVRHAQKQLALSLWQHTGFFKGSVLGFASPAEEGRLPNGVAYGSVSGSAYKSLPRIIADKFVVPNNAFSVENMEAKYQIYALAVLARDDLSGMVAANPSSMLKLAKLIEQNATELVAVLSGELSGEQSDESSQWLLPEAREFVPHYRGQITHRRLQSLQGMLATASQIQVKNIWSKLNTIATWTGGSCGIALQQLKPYLPDNTQVVEYGYGASEFMGSINVDARHNFCIPHLTHHVFEFVERGQWESGIADFVGVHELQQGKEYYVFVTTRSGLYRYDINDIVRAGEKYRNCPTIEFLQKGRGVANITGEKLSEHQVIEAVQQVAEERNIDVGCFVALADAESFHYDLYMQTDYTDIQSLAGDIDSRIGELNVEYKDKRESTRLRQLRVKRLPSDASETIKSWSLARGVREAQYKPMVLGLAEEWAERMDTLSINPDNLD